MHSPKVKGVPVTYRPLRSTVRVFEIGRDDRTYEATTDDSTPFEGVLVQPRKGPHLDLWVRENRFKFWGGGAPEPAHPTRQHAVFWKRDGREYAEPMVELRSPADVEWFKENGLTGQCACFIEDTRLV